MALGAERSGILRSILTRALQPVLICLAIGLVGGAIAAQSIRSSLFGLGPLDPVAFGGVAAVLLAAAALACYLPARRASSVDPVGRISDAGITRGLIF
jgi:putative ABC transport system permease protein